MDKNRIIGNIIEIERAYSEAWNEKEYKKIEETIEKHRAAKVRRITRSPFVVFNI